MHDEPVATKQENNNNTHSHVSHKKDCCLRSLCVCVCVEQLLFWVAVMQLRKLKKKRYKKTKRKIDFTYERGKRKEEKCLFSPSFRYVLFFIPLLLNSAVPSDVNNDRKRKAHNLK